MNKTQLDPDKSDCSGNISAIGGIMQELCKNYAGASLSRLLALFHFFRATSASGHACHVISKPYLLCGTVNKGTFTPLQ